MSYTVELHHSLRYSNKDLIALPELVSGLIAYQRLIEDSGPVIQRLFNLPEPVVIDVYLQRIEPGSTDETFAHRLAFPTKKHYDDFVKLVRKVTGIEFVQERNPTMGTIYAMLLAAGATWAVTRWSAEPAVHIHDVSNSIINAGAGSMHLAPEDVRHALRDGVKNKAVLATNAAKVIRPAKAADTGFVRLDDRAEFTIPHEAVKEVPAITGPSAVQTESTTVEDEPIDIRAIDRDNKKKGWAVVVPSFSPRRMKAELGPLVTAAELAGRTSATATVEIVYRTNEQGVAIPKRAFILEVQ